MKPADSALHEALSDMYEVPDRCQFCCLTHCKPNCFEDCAMHACCSATMAKQPNVQNYLSTDSCVTTVMSVGHFLFWLCQDLTFIRSGSQALQAELTGASGVAMCVLTAVMVCASCNNNKTGIIRKSAQMHSGHGDFDLSRLCKTGVTV